jgi:hypothetical protein
LLAGPIGYFSRTRKQGLLAYLALWAVVFPIQTVVVFSTSSDGNDVLYWIFNGLILGLGVGLNRLGAHLSERKGPAPA